MNELALTDQTVMLFDKLDIILTDDQKKKLIDYISLLVKWNSAFNLTSVRDPNEIFIKHILDSIVISPYLNGHSFIDVGTGAGLPGVPLSIVKPAQHFVLLDSLGKRVRFLKQVKYALKLENIEPVKSRVENYQSPIFNGIVTRAFTSLTNFLKKCDHLVAPEGRFYALKGTINEKEITEIPKLYRIDSINKLDVPGLDAQRHLIIVSKCHE